ncbi:MAG TPA: beta-hexosaminidase, partial [Stellaceae bacterium]|nr:beta-hexosaminidase [Stellaceae bacterium]
MSNEPGSGGYGKTPPRAIVFGCAGEVLSAVERAFFAEADPLGFLLFQRNCREPDQVRALVAEMRASVGRDDAPVLIDQEGGRVARLKPPHWRRYPAPTQLAAL